MNQKELVELIAEQIYKVSTFVEEVKNGKKELSTIEIDIAKERLRQMYNNFEMLSTFSNKNSVLFEKEEIKTTEVVSEKKVVEPQKIVEKPIIEKVESLPKVEPKKVEKVIEPENKVVEDEKIIVEEQSVEEKVVEEKPIEKLVEKRVVEEKLFEEKPIEKKIVEESVVEKKEVKKSRQKAVHHETTLADLFSDNSKTLSDKFQDSTPIIAENLKPQTDDNSVVAKLQRKKINDIRKAIGVNEKFLFINELFVGELKIYENSIANLNSTETAEDALNVLESLKNKHSWSVENPAYSKLLNIVERKFI